MKVLKLIPLLACTAIPVAFHQAAAAEIPSTPSIAAPATSKNFSVLEETPNQRRKRLGLPIVETFAPPSYGEVLETPNQRRQRLGLPPPATPPEPDYGVAEETPNHRRQMAQQ
jgi:hypothetical protein